MYRGDDETAYPDIFNNNVTSDDAETRAGVIRELKALSEKKDLESCLDTDELIRYFAVHNFLVNYDSYTGPMLHNYCLLAQEGRLSMLPWDYDSAFGHFPADGIVSVEPDSTVAVNTGIDSPLGNVADEARPMWSWILSDIRYRNAYHDALLETADIIDSGAFQKEADRVGELIRPFTGNDPKAFFTQDQFLTGRAAMLRFTELRAESVRKQVSNQLAARSELQNPADRVDASEIRISDMGKAPESQG